MAPQPVMQIPQSRFRRACADRTSSWKQRISEMDTVNSNRFRKAAPFRLMASAFAVGAAVALLTIAAAPLAHAASTVEVKMGDEPAVYMPATVTIKVGDTVKWINTGKTLHSVTLVPEDAQNPASVSEPKGAATFDSGFMPPDASYSHTFTVPGTYKYFCVPHEKAGMVGEVVVKK
jgi:plastocyanin